MKAREVKRAKMVAPLLPKSEGKYLAEGDYSASSRFPECITRTPAQPLQADLGRPKDTCAVWPLRIQFREMASSGLIPGVKKASW